MGETGFEAFSNLESNFEETLIAWPWVKASMSLKALMKFLQSAAYLKKFNEVSSL
jgi:hypothetical protein